MPLYEYRCQECDHLEEVLQKVSDPAPATCNACGREHTMQKEVSLTSFQLKGGGWYKDLYSSTPDSKGDKKSDSKSEGGKSKGGKSESGKSESGKSESGKSETKKSDSSSSSSSSKGAKSSKAA
jgi:putative FmdB family regulatory protein